MNSFELMHVGINLSSPEEAEGMAKILSLMFNIEPREGKKSVFVGNIFECMKMPFLGSKGHIAMGTDDLESAVEELRKKGFSFMEETASYDNNGCLTNIYISGEFGGFAIHILKKKK